MPLAKALLMENQATPATLDILAVARATERKIQLKRGLPIAIGLGLAAFGWTRRSAIGRTLGAVGVSLLLHSLRTEIEKAVHKLASKTSDRVDTASMGSFPASDPPALAQIGPRPTHAE